MLVFSVLSRAYKENIMATSSLYYTQDTPPTVATGHGTAALGPSGSTDGGSDIQAVPASITKAG